MNKYLLAVCIAFTSTYTHAFEYLEDRGFASIAYGLVQADTNITGLGRISSNALGFLGNASIGESFSFGLRLMVDTANDLSDDLGQNIDFANVGLEVFGGFRKDITDNTDVLLKVALGKSSTSYSFDRKDKDKGGEVIYHGFFSTKGVTAELRHRLGKQLSIGGAVSLINEALDVDTRLNTKTIYKDYNHQKYAIRAGYWVNDAFILTPAIILTDFDDEKNEKNEVEFSLAGSFFITKKALLGVSAGISNDSVAVLASASYFFTR